MFTPFRLNKTIGEAYNMDLQDSLNTKKALARLGYLEAPDDGFDTYPDQALIDALKAFQRAEGLTEDGVMESGKETFDRLNAALEAQPVPSPPAPRRETSPPSLLGPASEPGSPLGRHLASLPARPGAAPQAKPKRPAPEGVQVAMTRHRRPGEQPFGTEGAIFRDPFFGGVAAGLSAAAATKALMDQRTLNQGIGEVPVRQELDGTLRTDIAPPTPPLPGYQPSPAEDHKPQKTEFPAEPPQFPQLKGMPIGEEAKAQLYIFEELHDDLKRSLAKPIENRRGDAYTQRGNELVAGPCMEALKAEYEEELQNRAKHVGGGKRAEDGKIMKETYLKEKTSMGMKGSSFADVTVENELTKDKLHVNTANTLKDGKTPVAGERRNLYKMRNNANFHDVVTALPKLRPGMDELEYINRCIELLREPYYQWMGQPNGK